MGNALWKGVRLRDLLKRAGVRKGAVEVTFDGADSAAGPATPDFTKSLPLWKALDENTLVAFEMNGEPLPRWNGFPARLVVPGWTATYWVKQLTSIQVQSRPFDGFWMKGAYRLPKGRFALVDRFLSQETEANTPITEMVVNSLITYPEQGKRLPAGAPVEVRGVAWDGGYGIRRVDASTDGGRTWEEAGLGRDLGRFSWRQWTYALTPEKKGSLTILARATNRLGSTQTQELIWNPAGYHQNVIQRVDVEIV
jgi:DMSO/TMAO reductase YedYZ molybdopterin-dependent catalytic subunit